MSPLSGRSSLITSGVILAALFLFYPGIFLVQGAWLVGDHAEQHYPWAIYLAEHIRHFKIPFWTDLIQSGFPITAEGQIGSFYLPNLIFYFVFPIKIGYAWNILFHMALSGFFMAAFLRSMKLGEKAILFSVIMYLFASTLGGAYYNITSLKVLCWLPAALLILDKMWMNKKIRLWTIPVLGFLFSLQVLAGYLQYATYAILFALLYAVFRIWEPLDDQPRPIFRTLMALGFSLALCVALSFPQLFLTYQLAMESNRVDMPESFAYISSYPPFAIICLLFPSLEGLFASKLYLGILPIFFIFLALNRKIEKPYKTPIILAVISFLLALGQFSPLYIFIVKILHFHSFRTPTKFIFFTGFFLSVVAGYGVQTALNEIDKKTHQAAKFFASWIFTLFLCVTVAFIVFRFFPGALNQLGERLVKAFIYGKPGHPYDWSHYSGKLTSFIETCVTLLNPANPVVWIPMLKAGAAMSLVWLFVAKKMKAGTFYILAIFTLCADLYAYSFADIQRDYSTYEKFYSESKTANFLQENLGDYKYFIYSNDPSSSPLPAGPNMRLGLKTANAYSPLINKEYYEFMSKLGGVNDSTGGVPVDDAYLKDNLDKLRLLGVKFIISDRNLDPILGAPSFKENSWKTYLLQSAMPPYRLSPIDSQGTVKIMDESENNVYLQVTASANQTLVVSKRFDSGWLATDNGQNIQPVKADGILLGIPLTAGLHKVVLRYQPFHATVRFFKNRSPQNNSKG